MLPKDRHKGDHRHLCENCEVHVQDVIYKGKAICSYCYIAKEYNMDLRLALSSADKPYCTTHCNVAFERSSKREAAA
jgi:protein-arginine kinase activator protein McsA